MTSSLVRLVTDAVHAQLHLAEAEWSIIHRHMEMHDPDGRELDFSDHTMDLIHAATPYAVADDIRGLLAAAAPQLEEWTPTPQLPLSPRGFCFLRDEFTRSFVWEADPRYNAMIVAVESPSSRGNFVVDALPYGEVVSSATVDDDGTLEYSKWEMLRSVGATLLFMQQRLAVIGHRMRPPRAVRRAVRRFQFENEWNIVTLRRNLRTENSEPDEGAPDWSHRWIVAGHWASYWCGERGDQHLEPRFLAPYVKGPPDKPLLVRSRAFATVR